VLARSASHSFDCRIHDVTSGAEVVRMLRVIPCHSSRAGDSDDQHYRGDCKRNLDRSRARHQPVDDCRAVTDKHPEDCHGNERREEDTSDLNPWRDRRQQEADELPDSAREGRLDCD
jgi:hypothetical protein